MTKAAKVLIVEDDPIVASLLKITMEHAGFEYEWAKDGEEGILKCLGGTHDLMILDLVLPLKSGSEVLEEVRKAGKWLPILVYSIVSEANARARSLELGADDFITKPVDAHEIVDRLRALLSKAHLAESAELTVGDLTLRPATMEAHRKGASMKLCNRGFQLLYHLARNKNRVLSEEDILKNVWGYDFKPNYDLVEITVSRIRQHLSHKLGKTNLHTVMDEGFVLKDE